MEAGLLDEDEAVQHDQRHVLFNVIGSSDMRVEVGPALQLAARDTALRPTAQLAVDRRRCAPQDLGPTPTAEEGSPMADCEHEVDKIFLTIWKETQDRSKGSWKRAMWHGGKSTMAGMFAKARSGIGDFAKTKPGGLAGSALAGSAGTAAQAAVKAPAAAAGAYGGAMVGGVVLGPPGAALGALAGAVIVPVLSGKLAEKLTEVGKSLASTVGGKISTAGAEKIYKLVEVRKDDPVQRAERAVAKEMEKLKTETVPVIDRNIEKLAAAQRSAKTALQSFDQAIRASKRVLTDAESEALTKKADDAIRAWSESCYYSNKLTALLATLEQATAKVNKELQHVQEKLLEQQSCLKDQVVSLAEQRVISIGIEHDIASPHASSAIPAHVKNANLIPVQPRPPVLPPKRR